MFRVLWQDFSGYKTAVKWVPRNVNSLQRVDDVRRLLALELFFFLILAHPLYKMWIKQEPNILDFKLSPFCSDDKLSSGYFPGVWVLKTDVSEHCIGSIFNSTSAPVEEGTDTVFRNVGL